MKVTCPYPCCIRVFSKRLLAQDILFMQLRSAPTATKLALFKTNNETIKKEAELSLSSLNKEELLTPNSPLSSTLRISQDLLHDVTSAMWAINRLPLDRRPMELYTFLFHVKLDLTGTGNAIHQGSVNGLTAKTLADDTQTSLEGLAGSAAFIAAHLG